MIKESVKEASRSSSFRLWDRLKVVETRWSCRLDCINDGGVGLKRVTGLRVSQVLTQTSRSRRVELVYRMGGGRECVVCRMEVSNERVYEGKGMNR